MECELKHLFHEHPLILKANDDSNVEIYCEACLTPILGPYYGCIECRYLLHKVCAELPYELNHLEHPQHTLTLLRKPLAIHGHCLCDFCNKDTAGFVYHCFKCDFDVDTICAATSHVIEDKCHMHPLIPIQIPSSFSCHICFKKDEGVSYKCIICPFWVHQGCTVLPNTVTHSEHRHFLTLLPSVPLEHRKYGVNCDICHDKLSASYGSYACVGCLFYAHIGCARSESIISSSSRSRDQGIEVNQDGGQRLVLLPMNQKATESISRFVGKYNWANIINYCKVQSSETYIDNKIINHFDHEHRLVQIDDEVNEKTCDACALVVSPPFYGSVKCDYFLHKCCTELPKHILLTSHPKHQLTLNGTLGMESSFFACNCCEQISNGFSYRCSEGDNFKIDIKCASLIGPIYHEAHKHSLTPKFVSDNKCSACGVERSDCFLQCGTCRFSLCYFCAMAPPVVNHRYGKSDPFVLTYSPPENQYNEYICEICEGVLNPKLWFYHCVYADQFTHKICMRRNGATSNIKFGKSYSLRCHEHNLTLISSTYDCSRCYYCRDLLRTGLSVGFECLTCNFRIHYFCVQPMCEERKKDS